MVSECFNHLVARFVSLSPLLKVCFFCYCNAQDYLPKDLYHRVLGSLVDDVLAQIIMRLLKLTDIAEAETHKLYEILILMFACENLFDAEVILR